MLLVIFQLFEKHDLDKTGELEWAEFWTVISELGLGLSEDEISQWHSYADVDQSGTIKWSEFEPMAEELVTKCVCTFSKYKILLTSSTEL